MTHRLRLGLLVAFACTWAIGCPSDPTRQPVTIDAGSDAGRDAGPDAAQLDGSQLDGSQLDGSQLDGSQLDGSQPDAFVDDAAVSDAGVDAATGDAGVRPPVCNPGTACSAGSPCADGEICIANACGDMVCQARSAYCGDITECAAGSDCVTTAVGSLCTPTNGEVCNASTDCPANHACEGAPGSRSCVLRRIPCFDEFDCPISYMCLGVTGDSSSCQYAYRPCSGAGTCALSFCGDIDGNGSTECGAGGGCDSNASCTGSDGCVNLHFITECGLGGLCNQSGGAACASGWECRDLQGDGYGECVPQGGLCTTNLDCLNGGICAVPLDRSPPRCFYPM